MQGRRSFLQGLMTALVGASVPTAHANAPFEVGVPAMSPEQGYPDEQEIG